MELTGQEVQLDNTLLCKTRRQFDEFPRLDPRLRALVLEFAYYSVAHYNVTPVITEVCRTQPEQDAIYEQEIEKGLYTIDAAGVKHYSILSVHQTVPCRGIDFRNLYTHTQLEEIRSVFNQVFHYSAKVETLVVHNVGTGLHIHIQVPPLLT